MVLSSFWFFDRGRCAAFSRVAVCNHVSPLYKPRGFRLFSSPWVHCVSPIMGHVTVPIGLCEPFKTFAFRYCLRFSHHVCVAFVTLKSPFCYRPRHLRPRLQYHGISCLISYFLCIIIFVCIFVVITLYLCIIIILIILIMLLMRINL